MVGLPLLLAALPSLAAVERDDPAERLRAWRELHPPPSPEAKWRILQEALKERDRYSGRSNVVRAAMPVQGSVFVNLGPTRADREYNGGFYTAMDSGRVRQIIPHPANPNILYLSASGGGVWKTYDAGKSWEPLGDQLGALSIGTLAMDPASPEVLYLGFGDFVDDAQPGMVKSLDGGATWTAAQTLKSGAMVADRVMDIKIDPLNSLLVLVATSQGLFRSINAGDSYKRVALPGVDGNGASVIDGPYFIWSIAYAGPHTWIVTGQRHNDPSVTTDKGGDLGLWRSTDDGGHFTYTPGAIPNGEGSDVGRATLAAAPSTVDDAATSRIFMLASNLGGNAQKDVYRSDDGGQSWIKLYVNDSRKPTNPNGDQTTLDVIAAQAFYNHALIVDPENPDAVFVGGMLSMVRSMDAGQTWSVLSDWLPCCSNTPAINLPYVHADFHAFAIAIDGTFYAGTDGGIFRSDNARNPAVSTVTFTSALNEGLVTHLVYNVSCAPESWPANMQGWVTGGLQDNGTRVRVIDSTGAGTTTFDQLLGGDGIGQAVSGDTLNGAPAAFLATVEYGIFRSTDGGNKWIEFGTSSTKNGLVNPLPFFVRLARDEAASDPQTFLTYTKPAAVYRSTKINNVWQDVSGMLHWQNPTAVTQGFTTTTGKAAISLRNIATHPRQAGLWGAVSNKFAYVTSDRGVNWYASVQPKPPGAAGGVYAMTSIALDPSDLTGRTYYVTFSATMLVDDLGNLVGPVPPSFGHVLRTSDGGTTWQPLTGPGLPFVPANVIKVDPNDPRTLYVGTSVGIYRSQDGGTSWARFGGDSLPLVDVEDVCISPASKRLTVATFGRGFWQISTDASANPAGVKGRGDTNFDLRIDGLDLIDLADAFSSTQASPMYRYQADLVGSVNLVDDADLTAMLSKFGGQP
jgi:photosystem II stability/assembly factor-like uncharacterized protein